MYISILVGSLAASLCASLVLLIPVERNTPKTRLQNIHHSGDIIIMVECYYYIYMYMHRISRDQFGHIQYTVVLRALYVHNSFIYERQ